MGIRQIAMGQEKNLCNRVRSRIFNFTPLKMGQKFHIESDPRKKDILDGRK